MNLHSVDELVDLIATTAPRTTRKAELQFLKSQPLESLKDIYKALRPYDPDHQRERYSPSQARYVKQAIKDQRDIKYFQNLDKYIHLLGASDQANQWMLEALLKYRDYSWYPQDTAGPDLAFKISKHVNQTRRLVDIIQRYWSQNVGTGDVGPLAYHMKTSTNRHIWLLSDEELVRHLFFHHEDADHCEDIATERGDINYEMLRETTGTAVSNGWL